MFLEKIARDSMRMMDAFFYKTSYEKNKNKTNKTFIHKKYHYVNSNL